MGRMPGWDSVSLAVGGGFWLHVPKVPNPVSATNAPQQPPTIMAMGHRTRQSKGGPRVGGGVSP